MCDAELPNQAFDIPAIPPGEGQLVWLRPCYSLRVQTRRKELT
jgi:hypothetical protein